MIFSKFWNEIVKTNLKRDQFLLCQFKVKLEEGVFRSISHVQIVNKFDRIKLLDSFIAFWVIRNEDYYSA
jgi:hypothetical protein